MCYGMKCPYEFPSGECSIQGEAPEDAECRGDIEDECIREVTESKS